MFSAQTTPCTDRAGFNANIETNFAQGVGALAVVGTVTGSTLMMAWMAPLPTIGGLGAGAGLLYAGHKINQDNKAKAAKAAADAATPVEPVS